MKPIFQRQNDSIAAALRCQEFAIHHDHRAPNKSRLLQHHRDQPVVVERLSVETKLPVRGADPGKELGDRPVAEHCSKVLLGEAVREEVPRLKFDVLL